MCRRHFIIILLLFKVALLVLVVVVVFVCVVDKIIVLKIACFFNAQMKEFFGCFFVRFSDVFFSMSCTFIIYISDI